MSIRPNTTCDIYREGNAPPASPDVPAVPCCFISCFDIGRERGEKEGQQYRFTAKMLVPLGTDVRDDFNAWTGTASTRDAVYVPNRTGTGYKVAFVERVNRGLAGDALCVYLDRLAVTWPYPGPAVFAVNPGNGSPSGGTSVTVTGRGFSGATAVRFGATAASSFIVSSDTQLSAVSPAESAGTVDVTVTTPLGTSTVSSNDQFAYLTPYYLQFNGSNFVQASDAGLPAGIAPFTMALWSNATSNNTVGVSYGTYGTDDESASLLITNEGGGGGGSPSWTFSQFGQSVYSTTPVGGAWQCVVLTFDGTHYNLYVNGSTGQAATGTLAQNTVLGGGLFIGKCSTGSYLTGNIDDVRICNQCWTPAQIARYYNAGHGTALSVGGEVSWYQFNEGTGLTAYDSSSGGNNGTLESEPGSGSPVPEWLSGGAPF